MSRFLLRALRGPVLAASMGLAAATAGAAVLTLDGGGRLLGATGVLVAGQLYDVEFRDGSCIELFGGCDALSDFAFNTPEQVQAASQALVDQVFNAASATDLDATLTRGCENGGYFHLGVRGSTCWALTPFRFAIGGDLATHVASNDSRDAFDAAAGLNTQFVFGRGTSSTESGWEGRTFAVWSEAGSNAPVSVPGSAALAALGLLLLRATTAGSRPAR